MGCPPLGVTTKLVSLGICFQSFQTAFIEALELIEWVGKKQTKKTKKKDKDVSVALPAPHVVVCLDE